MGGCALDAATHRRLAGVLARAAAERRPLHPLTDIHAELTTADAYAIQRELVAARLAAGERIVGAKLGFTSRAMRVALGVDEPNHGWLTDRMLLGDAPLSLEQWVHPRVEPEIGFRLASPLRGPGVEPRDVLAATASAFPCLEVVDSRFHDYRFAAADNTADNSSAGGVRCGPDVSVDGLDLRLVGVVVTEDGDVVGTAAGAAALGDPAAAVAWLANRLAEAERALEAGDVVISGGLTAARPLRRASRVEASFDRLGSVAVSVA